MRLAQIPLLLSLLMMISCSASTPQQPIAAPVGSPSAANPAAAPTLSPANQLPTEAVKAKTDACALLVSKEVESVQGEPVKETKLTGQLADGFSMSQCFYTLPTFTNSISLLVAQKQDSAGAKDPREYWRDTFHEAKDKDKEKDHDRARERSEKKGEKEEEEGPPPQRISGVGDEAFWVGSRIGGALYVLKGNAYLRISVGGPADQATKITKSKTLAQRALARL